MILSLMMYVFGFTQLSSIHLGHDRNFTLLIYNENATRVREQGNQGIRESGNHLQKTNPN